MDIQTDTHTSNQIGISIDIGKGRQTHRQTDRHRKTDRQVQKDRQVKRRKDKSKHGQREETDI